MFDRNALKSEGFSWKSALSLALASQLAYVRGSQGVIQVAKDNWGYTGCRLFAAGDTQGFVAWDEACVLVSFRGTDSTGDWLLNASLVPTEQPYGRVHGGSRRVSRRYGPWWMTRCNKPGWAESASG
ncbi:MULTISPECIES: hypothetical protein [unclassified Thiocapsa]|uniref:hypothetical protein n=1 Tax=unclassified Thiocapsa TaxID=2641286 RepID=UPI0035B1A736